MADKENIAHRLALLQGVIFSPADLESIVGEIEDLERVVAELEEFAKETPWISLQTQPAEKGVTMAPNEISELSLNDLPG